MLCPPRWAVSGFVSHCPPPWSCLSLVSGLVSQLLSLFCLVACLSSGMCLPPLGLSFFLSLVLSPSLSPIWSLMLCPPRWSCLSLVCGLVSGLVCHLGWDAVSALLGCLRSCPSLSPIWSGMLCPPRWSCLSLVCGLVPGLVCHLGWDAASASLGLSPNLSPIWLCLSRWLGCCVRLAGLVSQFVSQFVSHLALSFSLAGVLCPPRWACLRSCFPICFPPGFVFHVGWGAVSASLGLSPNLSPNLSPIWLCLSPWLGCCVRLAGLVTQFVSQCSLPICFPSGFVFDLGWGAASASLGLSPVLSSNLSPNLSRAWLCLLRWLGCSLGLSPNLSPIWLCLSAWLGCCVRLAGLVSGLVSHLVSHLVWDAVSASLVLSFSCLRSCLRSCLPSWLGCCVRLAGLSPVLSPSLSLIWSGMLCPPPWSCLSLVPGLVSQLLSLFCLVACLSSGCVCPPWACLFSCLWSCLPSGLGCCVRLAGLVFLLSAVLSPALSAILAGMLCPPCWAVSGLVPACLPSGLGCCVRLAGLVFLLSLVLSWLGCCVRLAGLSPVFSPSLSPIWSGMLCPPPWSCLSLVSGLVSQLLSLFCLVACLSSGMLCLPPLGLSFSCLWSCLPACLGCCVRLLGSSPSPACLRSFVPSCFPAGLVCPCSGLVSKISCAICATVWGLRW